MVVAKRTTTDIPEEEDIPEPESPTLESFLPKPKVQASSAEEGPATAKESGEAHSVPKVATTSTAGEPTTTTVPVATATTESPASANSAQTLKVRFLMNKSKFE